MYVFMWYSRPFWSLMVLLRREFLKSDRKCKNVLWKGLRKWVTWWWAKYHTVYALFHGWVVSGGRTHLSLNVSLLLANDSSMFLEFGCNTNQSPMIRRDFLPWEKNRWNLLIAICVNIDMFLPLCTWDKFLIIIRSVDCGNKLLYNDPSCSLLSGFLFSAAVQCFGLSSTLSGLKCCHSLFLPNMESHCVFAQ